MLGLLGYVLFGAGYLGILFVQVIAVSVLLAAASSRAYTIFLDAYVPSTRGVFDTQVVITGAPLDGLALVHCG